MYTYVFVLRLWASAFVCVCVHVCARLHVCVYIDCSCRKPKHLHFVHLLESKQEEAGTERERERLHAIERERERQAAAWFIAAAKLLQYALECPSCLPSLSTALSFSIPLALFSLELCQWPWNCFCAMRCLVDVLVFAFADFVAAVVALLLLLLLQQWDYWKCCTYLVRVAL